LSQLRQKVEKYHLYLFLMEKILVLTGFSLKTIESETNRIKAKTIINNNSKTYLY